MHEGLTKDPQYYVCVIEDTATGKQVPGTGKDFHDYLDHLCYASQLREDIRYHDKTIRRFDYALYTGGIKDIPPVKEPSHV